MCCSLFCFLRKYNSLIPKGVGKDAVVNKEVKAIVQGIPAELLERKAYIYRPARTAMQSGNAQTKYWRIQFQSDTKWENPLMGWTSSNDPVQGLLLDFESKEAAVNYASNLNLDYEIEEPNEREIRFKSYADNFVYSPGKLKIIKTK